MANKLKHTENSNYGSADNWNYLPDVLKKGFKLAVGAGLLVLGYLVIQSYF